MRLYFKYFLTNFKYYASLNNNFKYYKKLQKKPTMDEEKGKNKEGKLTSEEVLIGMISNMPKMISDAVDKAVALAIPDAVDKAVALAIPKDVTEIGDRLSKLSRDIDDVYHSNNNAYPLESLVAIMSQAASVQVGANLSGFSTGKAQKMQILGDLNIGR